MSPWQVINCTPMQGFIALNPASGQYNDYGSMITFLLKFFHRVFDKTDLALYDARRYCVLCISWKIN